MKISMSLPRVGEVSHLSGVPHLYVKRPLVIVVDNSSRGEGGGGGGGGVGIQL